MDIFSKKNFSPKKVDLSNFDFGLRPRTTTSDYDFDFNFEIRTRISILSYQTFLVISTCHKERVFRKFHHLSNDIWASSGSNFEPTDLKFPEFKVIFVQIVKWQHQAKDSLVKSSTIGSIQSLYYSGELARRVLVSCTRHNQAPSNSDHPLDANRFDETRCSRNPRAHLKSYRRHCVYWLLLSGTRRLNWAGTCEFPLVYIDSIFRKSINFW